ncbi:hypothetical protein T484DRAFT_2140210 [Baffinella frigidus]|nr:hypothetical protein T484DRAFT_2140210 [Cryptophyta sp. CCMP2293]
MAADGSANLDSLNVSEFLLMAKESGLIDINLTKANVLNIFVYVQNDGNIMDDEEGDEDTEMDFSEFCEALCGCACYKTLDPYMSLEMRVESLFNKYMEPLSNRIKREIAAGRSPSSAPTPDSMSRAPSKAGGGSVASRKGSMVSSSDKVILLTPLATGVPRS